MAHALRVPAHFGVRSERYKLIFFYGIPVDGVDKEPTPVAREFYDLETDPYEMTNAYEDPAYATIIARMKQQLKEAREALDETDADYPAVQAIIREHWDK